ncbi:DUF1622 domain-containing protein [bacterium]|nr:DUF1622 domain-containing protein [bacterium]
MQRAGDERGGDVSISAEDAVHAAYSLFEWAGVLVIVGGLIVALSRAVRHTFGGQYHDAYTVVRTTFGRSILLGLELLVAADIIRTIAVELTLENLANLAVLIAVRTFLSWSLEVEIDGRWPWQRSTRTQRGMGVDS